MRTGTLVAQRLDVERAALTGEPVTLADGVAAVSVAATGLVAYRADTSSQRQLTWVDRLGAPRGTVGDSDATLSRPRVSPDGRRVIVGRTVQGNLDLWLLDGARTSRFTFDAANDGFPVWSPDGTRIVFRSNRTKVGDLYQKLTNGAGAEELLLTSDQLKTPSDWSGDGRFLLYHLTDPQTENDLWVVPMVGDRTPWLLLKTPFRENNGALSPDGRWVVYMSDESGRVEIYVRPFVPPSRDAGRERSARSGEGASSVRATLRPMSSQPQRIVRLTSFAEEERTRPALRYWLSRPARERLAAVEYLRRQVDGSGARLRRVHRVLDCPWR